MRRGITLIEVLVTLILLAIVAGISASLDTGAVTQSQSRAWHALESDLRRCSALATNHGGGDYSPRLGTFLPASGTTPTPVSVLRLPSGWFMEAKGTETIRFDARGRCQDTPITLIAERQGTIGRARLDGITLNVHPEAGR